MYVASVALRDFRNYRDASVEFSPGVTLVVGANGQGKSNLLEAVRLLSVGKSVRGASDSDVIRWGAGGSTIVCTLAGATASRLEMRIEPEQRKRVRVDGAALPYLSDLIGILRTVHLAPDAIDGQFRSPSGRRRMVDILISQIDRGYLESLKRQRSVVRQINALCKLSSPSEAAMAAWEEQLAGLGVAIARRRRELLRPFEQAAQRYFAELFGPDRLEVHMRATLPVENDDADPVSACAEALRAARGQALRTGFVTKGTHRDRFDVLMGGRALESHASQGQIKGAYFAWKLAEGDLIERVAGEKPSWLVDDPFSEMDRNRALRLLELFRDRGQVIVTSARDDDLHLDTFGFARRRVHDGIIEYAD